MEWSRFKVDTCSSEFTTVVLVLFCKNGLVYISSYETQYCAYDSSLLSWQMAH